MLGELTRRKWLPGGMPRGSVENWLHHVIWKIVISNRHMMVNDLQIVDFLARELLEASK